MLGSLGDASQLNQACRWGPNRATQARLLILAVSGWSKRLSSHGVMDIRYIYIYIRIYIYRYVYIYIYTYIFIHNMCFQDSLDCSMSQDLLRQSLVSFTDLAGASNLTGSWIQWLCRDCGCKPVELGSDEHFLNMSSSR